MAFARTLVRFAGALFLGGVAAVYDTHEATPPRVAVLRSGVAVRKAPTRLVIQPGKRALAIRVPRTALFEFGIRPTSLVDVLNSVQDPNANVGSTASILLRDVRVLAVTPRSASAASASETVVTLEVTPGQAEAIAMAQAKGGVSLALRGSQVLR